MDSSSHSQVAQKFSRRFLDHVDKARTTHRDEGVRVFSHGPLMLAVLVMIEDMTGESIITNATATEGRFNRNALIDMHTGILKALAGLRLRINSKNARVVTIEVNNKRVLVPITVFENMAKGAFPERV